MIKPFIKIPILKTLLNQSYEETEFTHLTENKCVFLYHGKFFIKT